MTYLIQISFERSEPVKYVHKDLHFVPDMAMAGRFSGEEAEKIIRNIGNRRPELIISIIEESE
jgi:hypothetical protein